MIDAPFRLPLFCPYLIQLVFIEHIGHAKYCSRDARNNRERNSFFPSRVCILGRGGRGNKQIKNLFVNKQCVC